MDKFINIVILYSNIDDVIEYAYEIERQKTIKEKILCIVVNKCSHIELEEMQQRLEKLKTVKIYIYDPGKNLGYLNGMLYGVESLKEEGVELTEWISFSNTDITFKDENFIHEFMNKNYESNIWCVGPSVYSPLKQTYDNPQYRTRHSKLKLNILILIFSSNILSKAYYKLSNFKSTKQNETKEDSCFVYSNHGCYFFLRKELIEILLERKYHSLMYSEEAYIAEIIREHGYREYYDASIEIEHHESAVTGKLVNKVKMKYISDSLRKVKKEFY